MKSAQAWKNVSEEDREQYIERAGVQKDLLTAWKRRNRPKRPKTAYSLFMTDFTTNAKETGHKFENLFGEVSVAWKALDDEEREVYRTTAASLRPKRIPNPKNINCYNLYIKFEMPKTRKAHPTWDNKKCMKNIAVKWNGVSKRVRESWHKKSLVVREELQAEIDAENAAQEEVVDTTE